jgi:hypothetical protein
MSRRKSDSQLEAEFQAVLIEEIECRFPGCEILKNDAKDRQGIPDLLILWNTHWAMLECKASEDSPVRPNQPYYVAKFDNMSFSAFIYPENAEEVLNAMESAFSLERDARAAWR